MQMLSCVAGAWFSLSSLSLSLLSLSLSAIISQMENWCDFETTWVFPLLQFLWRQTDAQNSYLSNDIIVLAVACIKAPLLGKHGNSILLSAQPVLKGIEKYFLLYV